MARITHISNKNIVDLANTAITKARIVNGNLILHKFDGTDINVGPIDAKDSDFPEFAPWSARAFRSSLTFMGLGDSLTDGQGNGIDHYGVDLWGNGYWATDAWPLIGSILSGGRLTHLASAAQGGFNIQQIRDTWLPEVLRLRPDLCVVLAGQNNLDGLSDQDLRDLGSIYDSLISHGITPVLATNVPSRTTQENMRLVSWVRMQARSRNLPLVDFHKTLVDPVTGLYKAGLSADGVHPTVLGNSVMGKTLADALAPLYAEGDPDLADASIDAGLLIPNPLFSGTGMPVGWSDYTGSDSGQTFNRATPAGVVGQQLVLSGGVTGTDFNIPDRHMLGFAAAIDITPGDGFTVELRAIRPGWNKGYLFNARFTLPISGVFRWQAPTGDFSAAGNDPNHHLQLDSRNGSVIRVSQLTVVDLTSVDISV